MIKKRSIYWSFNYLIISLRIIGLQLNTSTKLTPRSKIKWSNALLLVLACCVFITSLTLTTVTQVYLMRLGSSSDALYNIFSLAKLIFSSVIIVSFHRRRAEITLILGNIERCFTLFLIERKVVSILCKLRNKSIVLCLFSWTAIVYFSVANLYFNLIYVDLNQYLQSYWLGLQLSDTGRNGAIVLGTLETILYYLSTFCPTLFCSMYYTFLCSLIARMFSEFNTWLSSLRTLTARQAVLIRRIHNQLCCLAERVDDVLSLTAFFIYLIIVTDLSKYVYFLISKYLLISKEQNITEPLFVLSRVVHLLWLFFWISINASKLGEVCNKSLSIIHELTTRPLELFDYHQNSLNTNNNNFVFDNQLSYETMLLVIKLNERQLLFTVWKIFPITKGFILTILGAVLTYTIILLQLTPWVHNI